jgi:hypothetical protein
VVRIDCAVLLGAAVLTACASTAPRVSTPRTRPPSIDVSSASTARRALAARFDALAERPDDARRILDASARRFPEGDTLPLALAVAARVREDGAEPERVAALISLLVERAARRIGDLDALEDYGGQGTMIALVALALGHWRTAFDDARFDRVHHHVIGLLARALSAEMPMRSYPDETWPIDSAVAIRAVQLHDAAFGEARAPALAAAFVGWSEAHGTDPATRLPYSRMDTHTPLPPRGSDLSWRIELLASLAPEHAQALYDRYAGVFWLDRGGMCGFAEWAHGERERADVDSGPIFEGIGATASAFGIAAANAMHDAQRRDRLIAQLPMGRRLVESAHGERLSAIAIDARWVTGFLMGDATLFYALTAVEGSRAATR